VGSGDWMGKGKEQLGRGELSGTVVRGVLGVGEG